MNQTEIAVTLLSFIYVVALTHILQCFRDLWIARDRVKPSTSLLLWMVALLLFTIATWFPAASVKTGAFAGWQLAGRLLFALITYFGCAFVSPRVPEEGVLDLADYEDRNGAGFKLTLLALVVLSLFLNYGLRSYRLAHPATAAEFLPTQWVPLTTFLATAISLWRRERWIRTACALVVAGLSAWAMLGSLKVV